MNRLIEQCLYPNESMLERLTRRLRKACFGQSLMIHGDGSCTIKRGFHRTHLTAAQLRMVFALGAMLSEGRYEDSLS